MKKTSSNRLASTSPGKVAKNPPKDLGPVTVTTGKRLPPAPTYLGRFGQEAYSSCVQTLRDLGVEDAADARAVEAFAGAYEDYREARKVVDEQGMTYKTFTQAGELKLVKRPEVEIMAESWKRMSSLLSQMCMTPAARNKGKPKKDEEAPVDPFAKFLSVTN